MKKLMTCGLLVLGLVTGRSLGAVGVQVYHEWHVFCGRTLVRMSESERVEDGMYGPKVVPGRQINFEVASDIVSMPCSLAQAGVGLLLVVGIGIAGEEWWRRRGKREAA